ncbi:MAG: T9SS type A sorting domain-containing protein, partial [Bacteroidota bacterium]
STQDILAARPNYLSVYPNPVDRFTPLSLSLSGVFPGYSGNWELYDNLGRRVATQQIIAGGTQEVTLDGLPKGMYFWTLLDQGRLMNQGKIVVR